MSYDVSLYVPCEQPTCYRCQCGAEHMTPPEKIVFSTNYTSNCSRMWDEAGCPLHEWAYDKANGRTAETLIEPLRLAIKTMEDDPERFRAMNPENGWGDYEGALEWLRKILAACRTYPKASVYVSN